MSLWFLLAGSLSSGIGAIPVGAPPADRLAHSRASAVWSSYAALGRGKLLVAREQLIDPNFAESVVLLLEYGEDGATGLIINRPTEVSLSEVLEMEGAERLAEPVYVGGPVARGQMMLLLRVPGSPEDTRRVFEDVHVGGSRALLERMIAQPAAEERFRVYSGHSGWAPGQLEMEIERGGWHVMPGDADLVFSTAPSSVWPQLIRRTTTRWTRRSWSHDETAGLLGVPMGRRQGGQVFRIQFVE